MRAMLLLPLLGALTACGGADAQGDGPPPNALTVLPDAPGTRVEVAVVQAQSASLSLELPASVAASQDATLASPMGGYVEEVLVTSGQRVRKGQVVARIDASSRRYQHQIAEAQAVQAEAELARIQALGDAVSAQQVLAAETNATVARANADLARLNLSRSVVTARFSGEVADVFVDPGEVAGPGSPIARLVRTDRVTLELSVSDRDVGQISEGQLVTFRCQSVPGSFNGVVASVAPAADNNTRTFQVDVDVANPDGTLRPGMLGRVGFDRSVADEAVVIPQDWLVTRLDSSGVYVVGDDGAAVWQDVTVQLFSRDQAVLSSGLEPGDRVVTQGARGLAVGDPLLVVREGTCCQDGRVAY